MYPACILHILHILHNAPYSPYSGLRGKNLGFGGLWGKLVIAKNDNSVAVIGLQSQCVLGAAVT